MKKDTSDKLRLKIDFEGKPKEELEVTAYAFDRRGNLLAQGAVKKNRVDLDLGEDQARSARLFFASTPPEDRQDEISIKAMARMNAYEASWRYDSRVIELNPIPEILLPFWFWRKCRVRGKVVRKVEIGGEIKYLPVCHARVHICEVDQIFRIIGQLPELELFKLRDDLIVELERPFPRPLPDPPFKFDPGFVDPSPENLAEMNRARLVETERVMQANLSYEEMGESLEKALISEPLSIDLEVSLKSDSAPSVRAALQNMVEVIRPLICFWPYFWPYLECDEIRVLETDENGLFDTTIWYQAFGDKPDLYFWVEFMIGGVWETVYNPGMHCHTWWNYPCGTEVGITITDPRVPWCGDPNTLPGKTAAILTIGHNISIASIRNSGSKRGQLFNQAVYDEDAPMGGSLEPHVWFGDDLAAHNITHYLWSYRREGSVTWIPIDTQVGRHYGEIDGSTLTFKTFLLGPDPSISNKVRFKVQPKKVPPKPGVSRSWAPEVNARTNTASAFFLTHLLSGGDASVAAGKYELRLQFFHQNGSVAKNVDFKIPTDAAPLGSSPNMIDAPAGYLEMSGTDVVGFIMKVHIDNNPCEAEIYEAQVGANAAGTCGFIPYSNGGNIVNIGFKAAHENDFAKFSFRIDKGSFGKAYGTSGQVGDGTPPLEPPLNAVDKFGAVLGTFTESGGDYQSNPSAADLLGGCVDAAFAETLDVDAMATDGWGRLRYLDRNGVPKAFALKLTTP